MLEIIRAELEKTKATLEAQRDREVETQAIKAEQEIIMPKVLEIDNSRKAALQAAEAEHAAKVEAINAAYEREKTAFKESVKTAIYKKVNEGFSVIIAKIEKELAAE